MSQYLGDVSAYAYAVSKGYTGTEDEFAALMADYAAVGERAEEAATEAAASATAAAGSATTATEAATTASGAATNAAQSATAAGASATAAQTAAETAETAATNAAGSATAADASADRAEEIAHEITADWDSKADAITETASGDIATFADGADDMIMRSLAVNIDPVQSGSGDPSPDNVRPISGWQTVNVTRTGKNLFPRASISLGDQNPRTINVNLDNPIPAGEYIMSYSVGGTGTSFGIEFYNGATSVGTININTHRLTLTERATRAYIYMGQSDYSDGLTKTLDDIQLEAGATATAYEPYLGETFPVALPTEAGTVYSGTVDPVKGTLTVDKVMFAANTSTMDNSEQYPGWRKALLPNNIPSGIIRNALLNIGTVCAYNASNNVFYLPMQYYNNRSQSDWKALAIDVQCVYEIAEPVEYTLSAQEITTLIGYNTIYADCGGIESVEYTADTKKYIDSLMTAMQSNIAYVEGGATATRAYTAGQYVIVGGTLYKVTASIASGATFTPGTNITATTVGAELTAL